MEVKHVKSNKGRMNVSNLRDYCVNEYSRPKEIPVLDGYMLAYGKFNNETGRFEFSDFKRFCLNSRSIFICKQAKSIKMIVGTSIIVEYRKTDLDFIERNNDRLIFCYSDGDDYFISHKVKEGLFLLQEDYING